MNRLVSIFFLFVFSFSMTSFSAEIHYCKGELSDISFIGHSSCENCESHNSKCKMHKKKKCCETVVIEYESDEDCVNASFDINQLSAVQVIIVNYYLNLDLFVSNELDKTIFKPYPPPDIDKDIQVLIQSFLI